MTKIGELKFWLKQALWFVPCAYLANFAYAISSAQTGGTFGDTFGAANALFSGTALLMLVLAVILQREELEQVKKERSDTRKLLKGQNSVNLLQREAVERQIFEASFFAQFHLIVEEKQRLESSSSDSTKKSSKLDKASACAFKFVRALEKDTNHEAPKGQLKPLQEMRLLLRAILTLDTLLVTAPITEDVREQYFKLLMSVVDYNIVACTGALTIPYRNQSLSSKEYLALFNRFTPKHFLTSDFIQDISAAREMRTEIKLPSS